MEIKDSGERTEYSTGAVRDCKAGNGRCDLMPLDVVAKLLGNSDKWDDCIGYIDFFQESGNEDYLCHALGAFSQEYQKQESATTAQNMSEMLLAVSKHFEAGAEKYGEDNWKKGIPVHSYIDSAVRHYLKYKAGWTDEPHDRAFVWNLMCCIWTLEHKPELDDFTEEKK